MNIPVAPLLSNTFTVLPSWMSILSMPTFIHTSCRGLNVHLISLAFPFYTVFWLTVPATLSGSVIPALLFWALGTDCSIFLPQFYYGCHKLHLAITPRILALFPRSRMRLKALKKTFRTMPKTCQRNQYSLRYQLISAGHWLADIFGCNDKASRDDCLITLNVMRERRELDGVSLWIVLPTYTLFLFVYVYA